ncbi:MAG TPA: hypothetical protein VEZ90_16680, partial [Blastocatellia bacterium]|nr:hypothetical protein [Blastocatellia bacterium]
MKVKHHFWSSLVLGGAMSVAAHSTSPLAGAMIGGFVIDSDHVIDHIWSIAHGYPYMKSSRGRAAKWKERGKPWSFLAPLVLRRKLIRLPLLLHSYELLVITIAVAVGVHSPFLIALAAGYALHLTLDFIRHH